MISWNPEDPGDPINIYNHTQANATEDPTKLYKDLENAGIKLPGGGYAIEKARDNLSKPVNELKTQDGWVWRDGNGAPIKTGLKDEEYGNWDL